MLLPMFLIVILTSHCDVDNCFMVQILVAIVVLVVVVVVVIVVLQ